MGEREQPRHLLGKPLWIELEFILVAVILGLHEEDEKTAVPRTQIGRVERECPYRSWSARRPLCELIEAWLGLLQRPLTGKHDDE